MSLSGMNALYKNPIDLSNMRAPNFDVKYDLHRGVASILLVSTLLTIGELYFYKNVIAPQIRGSIDKLTEDASIIESVLPPEEFANLTVQGLREISQDVDSDEQNSAVNSYVFSPVNQSVRNEIIEQAKEEAVSAAFEYNTEENRQEASENVSSYVDVVVKTEEKIIELANKQTYNIGKFIVMAFAMAIVIIWAYLKGKGQILGRSTVTSAIVTVFFLLMFQVYFFEMTSNSFGYMEGSKVLYPTLSQIKEQVLSYLGGN